MQEVMHNFVFADTEHTNDSVCGHSLVLNTRFAAGDGLTIVRSLLLPEDERGIFFRISAFSEKREISSGFLSPVYAENAGLTVPEAAADTVFVCETPYDNDAWVKYETRGLGASGLAHECLALGDGKTGSGVCIGSVTHDVWKTGIRWFGSGEEISSLTVYGGAADPATRDKCPHGRITGRLLVSPTIYLTGSDDWRSCLNDYGRRNAFFQPKKLSFTSRIPFGFNSWGVMADKVSFRKLIGTSDFFKNRLSEVLPESGSAVYINIDSFWTNLALNDPDFSGNNDSALRQFVLHCRENGQNAGIYHTPFAYWGGMQNLDCMAEQTGFSWRELALKLPDGSCYGTLDGGVALDPTHPGTRRIISELYEQFIAMGFSYIKLDFLTHGACEGVWYDKSIQTGTQAYSDGMKYINDVIAGRMFINESIAPLFPYSFADGRRISCDAWYSIHDTCDVMNHMTYGFWERELYRHPDPDHLLIWGRGGMAEEGEARARISSAVCVGGSVLFGEDFVEPQRDPEAAFGRFDRLMRNPRVIALALSGIRFLPLAVNGQRAAQAFWGQADEKSYLILFSFKKTATELSVDLPLPPGRYRGEELWSGIADDEFASKLRRTLPPADAEIWCITEVHE